MIALKPGKGIELIIRAFKSHNTRFYGLGAPSTISDINSLLFMTKGPEGDGSTGLTALLMTRVVGFTASASKFVSFAIESVSKK